MSKSDKSSFGRLIRRVEVFRRGQPFEQEPAFLLEKGQDQEYIDMGWARRVSKYRISLTEKGEYATKSRRGKPEIEFNDWSATPDAALTEAIADGNRRALCIQKAWAPG